MTILLMSSLVLIIIALLVWVSNLKKSLKEHFVIERELQYEVGHDGLTGLASASLTIDRLNQSIKNAKRYKEKIAVVYLDVNYFKQINTSTGFDIYNDVLQILSQKLLETIREGDTVARVDGSEFIIILDRFEDITYLHTLINDIMELSKESLSIQHHQVNPSFSIGISIYPNDNVDAMTLLSHASTAMDIVKNTDGYGYKYYTPELAQNAFENEKLEYELVDSIENDELELYYQPQIDTLTNKMIGLEALVRWRHPTMGIISPELFIQLSKEIGFITDIDRWVIQEVIVQLKKWKEDKLNCGLVSLNLSLFSLVEDTFIKDLQDVLEDSEEIIHSLSFAISETKLLHDPYHQQKLYELSQLGVKLSMKNFATSSSSLTQLYKLSIYQLIIDRTFIMHIGKSKNKENIIKSIISIAKNMDICILATGVETQEEEDFLLKYSCSNLQGHFYNKPLKVSEINQVLEKEA